LVNVIKKTERIRSNTQIRRRKLFETGIKRNKSTVVRFNAPDIHYGLAEPLDNILTEEELNNKQNALGQVG